MSNILDGITHLVIERGQIETQSDSRAFTLTFILYFLLVPYCIENLKLEADMLVLFLFFLLIRHIYESVSSFAEFNKVKPSLT